MTHFTLKHHNDHAVSCRGNNPVAVAVSNLLKCLFDVICVHRKINRCSGLNYMPKLTWLMILCGYTLFYVHSFAKLTNVPRVCSETEFKPFFSVKILTRIFQSKTKFCSDLFQLLE